MTSKTKLFWKKFQKSPVLRLLPLITALLGAYFLVAQPLTAKNSAQIQFISPEQVSTFSKSRNYRALDVRTNPLEYIAGHLPRAVNIADSAFRGPNGFLPVQYWDNQKLGEIFSQSGISTDSRVLVYSDGRDVLGATMVAYLLERLGVKDIAVLDGGFAGYKSANAPVTKEFPRYTKGGFTVKDNPSIRVSLDQVKTLIGKKGVVFIDPRPPELFRGEKDIWVRNGHIPGSRNIPWPTFTQANNPHRLKSLEEIRQLLAERKITPADDIIVTCSTGREATLQYAVLKHLLGYPRVRIYEGSWTEYSTTSLPVATGAEQVANVN